jgi:hypothetical protein
MTAAAQSQEKGCRELRISTTTSRRGRNLASQRRLSGTKHYGQRSQVQKAGSAGSTHEVLFDRLVCTVVL